MNPPTDLLSATLQIAVPLRILELATRSPALRDNMIRAWAANAVEPLCARGDVLQYSGKSRAEKRDCADTFNHLARGLAALSYQPGGVRFTDTIWCAQRHPGGTQAGADQACQRCLGAPETPTPQPQSTRRRHIEIVDLLAQLGEVAC